VTSTFIVACSNE